MEGDKEGIQEVWGGDKEGIQEVWGGGLVILSLSVLACLIVCGFFYITIISFKH